MHIISIAIQKGGSGKTTTTINLAAALQQMGKKVLLIDMDPQANLTQSLGFRDELKPSIYHALRKVALGDEIEWSKLKQENCNLDLLPASLDLANAELELVSVYGRENLLKKILQQLPESYDFVFIDCPPSVGILTVNALTASHFVFLPLQAEFLPLKGLQSFMRMYGIIKAQANKHLEILGIVLTKYDPRKIMNRDVLEILSRDYGEQVFLTHIRTNISLAKAQEKGVDIFTYEKTSNGAYDYMQLAREFLLKLKNSSEQNENK